MAFGGRRRTPPRRGRRLQDGRRLWNRLPYPGMTRNSMTHENRPKRPRNWRHIHHSPLFWIGAVLFAAAITIYVLSGDLSWRPRLP
jgi:hypothetical protein